MDEFTAQDPNFDARVRAGFASQQMMRTLEVTVDETGSGLVRLSFPHNDAFAQHHGFLHAGALTTVLDTACGFAAATLMPANTSVLTVEFKVNFLRPAAAERYHVFAEVLKPGRTLTVCQATATGDDLDGKPLAAMTGTIMAMPG